jgi:hypothetical protein
MKKFAFPEQKKFKTFPEAIQHIKDQMKIQHDAAHAKVLRSVSDDRKGDGSTKPKIDTRR